jgi:hypothetical protein
VKGKQRWEMERTEGGKQKVGKSYIKKEKHKQFGNLIEYDER